MFGLTSRGVYSTRNQSFKGKKEEEEEEEDDESTDAAEALASRQRRTGRLPLEGGKKKMTRARIPPRRLCHATAALTDSPWKGEL